MEDGSIRSDSLRWSLTQNGGAECSKTYQSELEVGKCKAKIGTKQSSCLQGDYNSAGET